MARVDLPPQSGIVGYLIDSSLPVSAASTIQAERGIAYLAGVAIEE